ncbi:MAG: SagB family peptide dehydrogenase [Chloroflexi bacterium]|nr:SagB family peptide dehydrogenase [Chloroflexota bacterium]
MAQERNQESAAAWRFHNATKYVGPVATQVEDADILMGEPPHLVQAMGEQNRAIEPLPYKIYTTLEPILMPREFPASELPALEALAATGELPVSHAVPDLNAVARLCLRSNGVLKRWRSPSGREFEFRAASCTGARYHLELYLVCGELPGLAAGIYQYAAHDHSLRQLRAGDYRAAIIEATGHEPAVAAAPIVAIWTSTFWRNGWRYQARAYRHVYWDTATALTNLLAVAADARLPVRVVLGFADHEINALLDIDGVREAAVCLVALGRSNDEPLPPPEARPLGLDSLPLSEREITFPEIGAMHSASSLASGAEAKAWRAGAFVPEVPLGRSLIALRPIAAEELPPHPIDAVIERRRSNRHYEADTPMSFAALSTMLTRSLQGTEMDCLVSGAPPLSTPYLIVNNVAGLRPGAYAVHWREQALELLQPGEMRAAAARLACDQGYAGDAHVNVYTLTDLAPVLEHFGNRGYRVAQLEAALIGAKLQLAAHALGLGAVGSTAYDDEVTAFFSPHAAKKSFMFVAVFGTRLRRSTSEVAEKSRFLQVQAQT